VNRLDELSLWLQPFAPNGILEAYLSVEVAQLRQSCRRLEVLSQRTWAECACPSCVLRAQAEGNEPGGSGGRPAGSTASQLQSAGHGGLLAGALPAQHDSPDQHDADFFAARLAGVAALLARPDILLERVVLRSEVDSVTGAGLVTPGEWPGDEP